MTLDKYSQLKIASNVLGFTIKEFANENDTSIQVIRDVCLGYTTSARLTKAIDSKIKEGNEAFDRHRSEKNIKAVNA